MKHRDAYTLEGGNTMQQTSLGKLARCLMAVFVVVGSLALVACPGDDEEGFRNVDARFDVTEDGVDGIGVTSQQLTFPNGAVFTPGNTDPVTFTFDTPTTFTAARGASTSTGDVAYASCTLTVTGGTLLPLGTFIFIDPCQFRVRANNVEVGGDEVVGTLTLIFVVGNITTESSGIAVELNIGDDGNLFVNGFDTGIDTDVTGTTGSTGQ